MTPDTPQHAPVTIWIDATHAGVARRILDLMGSDIEPVAVGGRCSAEVEALARHLDCPGLDDLRKLLVDWPTAQILLAASLTPGDSELLEARAAELGVLTLEPLEAGLSAPAQRTSAGPHLLPSFLRSPGWVKAADPLQAIGAAQSTAFLSINRAGDCSLGALLFDAWQFLLTLTDVPEGIDCTLAPLPPHPPEALGQLSGHLTAHGRLADGRGVVLQVSDQGPDCRRTVQIMGADGWLRADDLRYELLDTKGRTIDRHDVANRHVTFADLVVDQWRELLHGRPTATSVPDARCVWACCQACLLSIRTRTAEDPRKLATLGQL